MTKRWPLVPEAKESLDKMKTEYANEIGVKLDNDYKGNRASKLNGAVGGSRIVAMSFCEPRS